ncbi:MAG: acyl carrier protein [Acidobacteriota bacterium]
MPDPHSRLRRCFEAVFPELEPDGIAGASMDNVAGWDSIASVQLIAVVEEEFGITVPADRYEEMSSFEGILSCVLEMTR